MSKTLVQPVGQKRLTNVAVVRLKKHDQRFEIACYKNKVLSCILEKGELQVAGKERESQLSSQFRDIATIVMQKTYNPETQRPYTISMIERLMHDIHFAIDPNSSSKKQALEVIRELQKHFPIKRSPMRLRLTVPEQAMPSLIGILLLFQKRELEISCLLDRGSMSFPKKPVPGGAYKLFKFVWQNSLVCELEPGLFRDCDALVRNLQGRLDILAVNLHLDSDTNVDHFDDLDQDERSSIDKDSKGQLSEKLQKQTIEGSSQGVKQQKCSTCNAFVGDTKEYREQTRLLMKERCLVELIKCLVA